MAGANDEDMCDDALAHPINGEAATSKRQRLNITDPKDQTQAAPSLPSSSCQLTAGEVHAPPQDTLSLPTLPHELIVGILSRLPVKFLLQLRCVCKSWKSLISDPQFVKKHLSMSIMNPKFANHRLILSIANPKFDLKSCSVESIYGNQITRAIKLKYPLRWKRTYDTIVGSYNGLICFSNRQNHVLMWNPSIRIFKKSPDLGNDLQEGCFTVYGFGYDHIDDSYKAVAIFCSVHSISLGGYKTQVKVFTPSTDYWRVIQPLPAGIVPEDYSGKCVSGTLNWGAYLTNVSGSSWVIISLDLRTESYQKTEQPDYEAVGFHFTLGVLRDCLCILCEYQDTHLDVWLMKEYGVKESWTKLFTIPHSSDPESFGYSVPLFISGNGEVLLTLESQDSYLVLYNSRDATFKRCEIRSINGWFETQVYVESLVSPVSISS